MDIKNYKYEYDVMEDHWWFKGRRLFFMKYLKKYAKKSSFILDVGSSTGTNLKMLEDGKYNNYIGIDISNNAIKLSKKRGFKIRKGNILNIPYPNGTFDFIIASDILEHIDNDKKGFNEIFRVLKKGGFCIITVPMNKYLWGPQDKISHHKRRYSIESLKKLINHKEENNFKVIKSHYFNFILFFPILVTRLILNAFKFKESENNLNNNFINYILYLIFRVDIFLSGFLNPFFGVSYFMLIKKNDAH